MLSAILHGKAGRIQLQGEETRVRWREVFQCSEDLLSAVFFSRVRYLSPQSTLHIMALLIGEKAAAELGELKSLRLWSRLEGTGDRSWVEPDVQMHFANALVVIEVKPPSGGVQYIEQWRAQIQALAQEMTEADDVPLHFHYVALGNNTFTVNAQPQIDFGVDAALTPTLHQLEWDSIAQALSKLRSHAIASDRAVFEDWTKAFALFGITVKAPFLWPKLLEWNDKCGLSTALVPWPLWHTPHLEIPAPLPAPTIDNQAFEGIRWGALQSFSFTHPLHLT